MATGVHVWSTTAGSNGSVDSAINFAEGQAPSSVNDSARGVMAKAAEYAKDTAGSLTTAGTATAYTLAPNAVFASLTELDGQCLTFKVNATSGAAPTLNVNSLGAKALHSVGGTALPTGALVSGGIYSATYDNANSRFVVHGSFADQPLDATLTALAGVTTAADKLIYATASDVFATTDLTTFGRSLIDDAAASNARTTLGLVISTDVRAATLATRQTFLSGTAATYTTPAGARQLRIRMVGGGGGGGAAQTNAGATGTASSFNSIVANPGAGGTQGNSGSPKGQGGAGGSAGSGSASFRIGGGAGGPGTSSNGAGGNGGAGAFGGNGAGGSVESFTGQAGSTNSGGGGGGAGVAGGIGGGGGGAGEYIELTINSPSATYTYTVGPGGAGGAAGSVAGGAGATGIIIVDEYY